MLLEVTHGFIAALPVDALHRGFGAGLGPEFRYPAALGGVDEDDGANDHGEPVEQRCPQLGHLVPM